MCSIERYFIARSCSDAGGMVVELERVRFRAETIFCGGHGASAIIAKLPIIEVYRSGSLYFCACPGREHVVVGTELAKLG